MDVDSPTISSVSLGNIRRELTVSVLETPDYLHSILPTASLESTLETLNMSNSMRTPLMAHQRSAVNFMQKIEGNAIQGHEPAGEVLTD